MADKVRDAVVLSATEWQLLYEKALEHDPKLAGKMLGEVKGYLNGIAVPTQLTVSAATLKGIKALSGKKWSSTYSFADKQKLDNHFEKHSKEFGKEYTSPSEYLEGARNVIQNGYKLSYNYKGEKRNGYVMYIGNTKKGDSKFAFVGTNNKGNITTYHVESGKDFWKMINGDKNIKVIDPIK